MSRPTSFRLSEDLLSRLDEAAAAAETTTSALVTILLDEGLRIRRFPGILYRDGATGRRAGLVGGPDVWEVVRDLRQTPGKGTQRLERLAASAGLTFDRVLLAVNFYSAFPAEIDARIEIDEKAAEDVRKMTEHRERLLAP